MFYLTTAFQKNSQEVNYQSRLHNFSPNWALVALSNKREFIEKVDHHYSGLLCPIMPHNFKKLLREQIMRIRLHNFCANCPLPQKGTFLENLLILLMPNYCTIAKIFLKISRAINTNCVTLGQTGPILLQKEIFLGKLTNVPFVLYFCIYCVSSCHKISKKFPEWNYFGLSIESHHTTTFQNSQRAYNEA